jgi:flagellar motor component MotA
MRKFFIVSVILFLALCAGAIITAGGNLLFFLNIPSLILVVGIPFVMLLSNHSLREMGAYFSAGFRSGEERADPSVIKKGVEFFTAMRDYLILSGFVGALTGVMTMLSLFEDVDRVGFGAALSLMTIFYAVLLIMLIALPFKHGLHRRLIELEE